MVKVTIRLSDEMYQDLIKVKQHTNQDTTEVVKTALHKYIQRFTEQHNSTAAENFIRMAINENEYEELTGNKPSDFLKKQRAVYSDKVITIGGKELKEIIERAKKLGNQYSSNVKKSLARGKADTKKRAAFKKRMDIDKIESNYSGK